MNQGSCYDVCQKSPVSSNVPDMRSIYKDLIGLLEDGTLGAEAWYRIKV
jgi:hypothetical protein